MFRISWMVAAWWSGRLEAVRQARLRPSPRLERLLGHGRAAWRRRWLGMAVAWLLCLAGWAGSLLAPEHYRSSALLFADPGPGATLASHANGRTQATLAALQRALSTPAARARVAAAAPVDAVPTADRPGAIAAIAIAIEAPALFRISYRAGQPAVARRALQSLVELVTGDELPPAGPAAAGGADPELQAGRDRAAGLRNELAAALMQRDARARQLAEVPPALTAGRPNPIHEQMALQLGRQETLIAGLRDRLAAAEAEIASLAPGPGVGSRDRAAAADPRPGPADPAAPAAPSFRLVDPPDWPDAPEGAPRAWLLAAVFGAGLVAGAAAAAWAGQLDGTIDGAGQLERRFRLPVLGTLAAPLPPGQRRLRHRAEPAFGLAGLGLLALFGGLLSAEAFDLLAPLALRLHSPVAG